MKKGVSDWARTIANEVETRLADVGDAASASAQRAYMKSQMRFHGVPTKTLHEQAREIAKAHPQLTRQQLHELTRALWSETWWDLRNVAISLLDRRQALLTPEDLDWLVGLCRDAACWAHVDELATRPVGGILRRHPIEKRRLREWAKDPQSFWVRRTALLSQLRELREGGGDFEIFEAIAVPVLEEKEFFIRKAIGWVLRDTSKKRPALVRGFVARHGEQMSGLSRREATKYL